MAAACLRLEVQGSARGHVSAAAPPDMSSKRGLVKGPMVSKVDRLRCDACGIEIPVEAIVGLDDSEAMTAEEPATHCRLRAFLPDLHRR